MLLVVSPNIITTKNGELKMAWTLSGLQPVPPWYPGVFMLLRKCYSLLKKIVLLLQKKLKKISATG